MNKSRIVFLLLAIVMLLGIVAACSDPEETDAEPTEPTEPTPTEPTPQEPPPYSPYSSKTQRDTLVIGTSAMGGDFLEGWGNNQSDTSIKVLTGNSDFFYSTVYYTESGELAINPTVVKDVDVTEDEDGNKTYTWTLHEDLKWNNGETITAKDYVASVLFYGGSELTAAIGVSNIGNGLIGYADYKRGYLETGETDDDGLPIPGDPVNTFAGVQLLGSFQFSMTIDAEQLPYFWEYSYVKAFPVYSAGWFPGIDIISDENGSRFSASILAAAVAISNGEVYAPTVTCGPYNFVSFDGSIVNLRRNHHFKSDPYGRQPSFEFIIQMEVPFEADIDLVISGDIDLATGNVGGAKVAAAVASEYALMHSYQRNGYGFIAFPTDWGVTSDQNVRWAIAHMIDRNTIIDSLFFGSGGMVDASFGTAQWTYQSRNLRLAERLTPITFNLERANELLDQTEWRFEADGSTPFDPAKANPQGTYTRHNRNGEMLVVRHLSASELVGGAIEAETSVNSPLIGMRYEIRHSDFGTLRDHYYSGHELPDSERVYNAFNISADFPIVDDKYWSFHSDHAGTWMNAEQVIDDELDELIMSMRRLAPDQKEEHADIWVDFQVRWQEILPQLPVFSNEYFDVYNSVVTQVPTTPFWNYQEAICLIAKHP